MTTENWLTVLDQIPKNSRVTLTGGDPFMFKDFETIFSNTKKCFSNTKIICLTQ